MLCTTPSLGCMIAAAPKPALNVTYYYYTPAWRKAPPGGAISIFPAAAAAASSIPGIMKAMPIKYLLYSSLLIIAIIAVDTGT